jgi:uncharacterized small protein (DUF1192 family)
MALFDDDRPKPKRSHEIGQDLSLLSVSELDERMEMLELEIKRLRDEKDRKAGSKAAAESFFR